MLYLLYRKHRKSYMKIELIYHFETTLRQKCVHVSRLDCAWGCLLNDGMAVGLVRMQPGADSELLASILSNPLPPTLCYALLHGPHSQTFCSLATPVWRGSHLCNFGFYECFYVILKSNSGPIRNVSVCCFSVVVAVAAVIYWGKRSFLILQPFYMSSQYLHQPPIP